MKKISCIFCAAAVLLSGLCGCGKSEKEDIKKVDLRYRVADSYDLPASEPADASFEHPSRNWSLINRINQKHRRPEDAPIPFDSLTTEEKGIIRDKGLDLRPVKGE